MKRKDHGPAILRRLGRVGPQRFAQLLGHLRAGEDALNTDLQRLRKAGRIHARGPHREWSLVKRSPRSRGR